MSIGNAKLIGKLIPLIPDIVSDDKEKSEFIKTWPVTVKLPSQEQRKKKVEPKRKYKARKKRKPRNPLAEIAKPEIENMIVTGYINAHFINQRINPYLKPGLVKVYIFIVLRIIIQHKGYEFITVQTIKDGWKRGYDYNIDGTGLSRTAIYTALKQAQELNLLFIYDQFKEPLIILNTNKGKDIYDKLVSGRYTYTDIVQFDNDLYYSKIKPTFFELSSRQEKLDILNSGILLRCKIYLYTCKLILQLCQFNLQSCQVNSYKKIVETITNLELTELSTIPELIINGIKYRIDIQQSDQGNSDSNSFDDELKNPKIFPEVKPEEMTPEKKEKIAALKKKLSQHNISGKTFNELISKYGYIKVDLCVKDIEEKVRAGVYVKRFSGLLISSLEDFDCSEIIEEQKLQESLEQTKKSSIEKNKKYLEVFKCGRPNIWGISEWDSSLNLFADFWLTKYQDYSRDIVERANYILYEKYANLAPEHQDKQMIKLGVYNKSEEEAIEILSAKLEQQNIYFEELMSELVNLISTEDLKNILLEAVEKDNKIGNEELINRFCSNLKSFL